MNLFIYSLYRHGSTGLSNLIMSMELGVVMSALTDRVLVLKGNNSPPANIVQYGKLISNAYPSKVTDLIDLGVPWIDVEEANLTSFVPHELWENPVWECVFCFPSNISTHSDDFRSFAQDRKGIVTVGEELRHVPALSFSGGELLQTLSFHSPFFYLDEPSQLLAYEALRRMKPKPEYSVFADMIVKEIGPFNAAHIRRGDFKVTTGVTTLNRKPKEAIDALDKHFSRKEKLVILTDEAEDPFFEEIKIAYPDSVFLDHFILENYQSRFLDLPAHDSLSLAYISQLIAAESQDFIGTMTSTFTAMIQRMRGSKGKKEPFKFLWNELPSPGDKLEPGRHPISESVPLKDGIMVEQCDGPYSWNRFQNNMNRAWMREWPESFLDKEAMLARARSRELDSSDVPEDNIGKEPEMEKAADSHPITFLGSTIIGGSNDEAVANSVGKLFALMKSNTVKPPICEIRIEEHNTHAALMVNGKQVAKKESGNRLIKGFYRQVVSQFIYKYPELVWLHAGCAASDNGALLLPGSWGRGKSTLVLELISRNWKFLSDDVVPLDPESGNALPFPGTPQFRSGSNVTLQRNELGKLSKSAVSLDPEKVETNPQLVSMVVFPFYEADAAVKLQELSPVQAVGELLENCLSFPKNNDATIERFCKMIERLPVYRMEFGNYAEAAQLLVDGSVRNRLTPELVVS